MRTNATDKNARSGRFAGLAADSYGIDDERAPLILLHGLSYNRAMWAPTLTELHRIDPDRRVLAVDLPGHGESPSWPEYDERTIVATLHDAAVEAGLDAPVVVGHSAAGIVATLYAAMEPCRGVVNVDAAPEPGVPIAALLKSLADRLDPDGFPAVWQMFVASMRQDLLPPDMRELLRRNTTPDRDLLVGYWQWLLTNSAEDIDTWLDLLLRAVRESGLHYVVVSGQELPPGQAAWLVESLPQIELQSWAGSGHFPHLAHPRRFARLLQQSGRWTWSERVPGLSEVLVAE